MNDHHRSTRVDIAVLFVLYHWKCIRIGENWGKYGNALSDLDPNELDLSFPAPSDSTKFHQILFKMWPQERWQTDTDKQTDRRQRPVSCYATAVGQRKCKTI